MNSHIYNKKFWLSTLIYLILCALVCVLPIVLTQCDSIVDFTETGQIGDTIGGVIGPFIAMIAAYLTFIAFWIQYQANVQQRNDIAMERFNQNFYNMMNLHEQITNSLEFTIPLTNQNPISHHGRELFYYAFERVKEYDDSGDLIGTGMRTRLMKNNLHSYVDSQTPTYFDHYFRNMYRIIKYVDESSVFDNDVEVLECKTSDEKEEKKHKKKYEYIAVLRSTLSRYELVWLFYNCLSEYGCENFKPLVEKYALLKNLRSDLLIKEDDMKLYNPKAFGV